MRKNTFTLFSALSYLLIAAPVLSFAQSEPITYKSVPLRASASEFSEKLPAYKCTGPICTFSYQDCQGSWRGISDNSVAEAYIKRGQECRVATSFGGSLVTQGYVIFGEKGMAQADLTVPTPQMAQLADSVELKYGAPSKVDKTPVQTKAGVSYENWVKTWNIGPDVLILELRLGRIDDGRVLLVTNERLIETESNRMKRAGAGAKDF